MASDFLGPEKMRSIVRAALSKFGRKDMMLLHVGANELTLAHRVAIYMETKLRGWHVDCEYNRDRSFPKMRKSTGKRIIPDIIVHRRNKPQNLLIVEIKKSCHSKSKIAAAKQRAWDLTGEWKNDVPRYCHALVMIFPVRRGEPKTVACEWYHRDGCNSIFGGPPKIRALSVPLIRKT
jgi:hypothetical protein